MAYGILNKKVDMPKLIEKFDEHKQEYDIFEGPDVKPEYVNFSYYAQHSLFRGWTPTFVFKDNGKLYYFFHARKPGLLQTASGMGQFIWPVPGRWQ